MYDAPELAERYDRVSDLQFESGRKLVDKMGIKKGDDVLDVGCGTGRLALHVSKIVQPSGQVVGIDPSPHRIRIADARLEGGAFKNVSFRIGYGEDLSAFSDTFDHVYYSSVFHWIEDKRSALSEAGRVLKPGGKVGITTVDRDFRFTMKQIMEKLFTEKPYSGQIKMEFEMIKLVNGKELEALLEEAGFKDITINVVADKLLYSSPDELLEFMEASSFGNFLRYVPEGQRSEAIRDIKTELEKLRTGGMIELLSNIMYAIAVKP